jgi:hypothetical protein
LVESVIEEIYHVTGDRVSDYVARGVIRAVADWLNARDLVASAAMLRNEANR